MTEAALKPFKAIKNRVLLLANHSLLSAEDAYTAAVHQAACQLHNAGTEVIVLDCFSPPASTSAEPVIEDVYYVQLALEPSQTEHAAQALQQSLLLYKPALVVSFAPQYLVQLALTATEALQLPLLLDMRQYPDFAAAGVSEALLAKCRQLLAAGPDAANLEATEPDTAWPDTVRPQAEHSPCAIVWPLQATTLPAELGALLAVNAVDSKLSPQQLNFSRVLQNPEQQAQSLLPDTVTSDGWYKVDDNRVWKRFTIAAHATLAVHGAITYSHSGSDLQRKAVLLVQLQDKDGNILNAACRGLNWSEVFNCHFVYLPHSEGKDKQIVSWQVPDKCVAVAICACGFYLKAPATVALKQLRLLQDNKPALVAEQWNYINHYFYNKGEITFVRSRLDRLLQQPVTVEQNRLAQQIRGIYQMKQGIDIPPRQSGALYQCERGSLLYCLHQSLPYVSNGYATRSHGIAKGLRAAGWQVNVSTRPGFPWDTQDVMASTTSHTEVIDGIAYSAYKSAALEDIGLDNYIQLAADHFCRQAQHCRASIIIAASNHVTAIPALIAARRLGIPFVYELRGLWHLTKGSLRPDWAASERFALEHELELLVAQQADQVFTLTRELKQILRQGQVQTPIELAPNAVDCKQFQVEPADNSVRQQLGIAADIPVIGYAGSAVGYEGLDVLMDALAILARQGQAFAFVLLGDGAVLEQVKQQAEQLNILPYCHFAGRVAFTDVARYINCMDIMPVVRRKSAVTDAVSALKPLEAMAMAKTLVLSDVSPHYEFAGDELRVLDTDTGVRLHQRALMCHHDDARSLASALKFAIVQPELRLELGANALHWVTQQRSWQAVTQSYSCGLQQLLQQATPAEQAGAAKPVLALIADEFTSSALAAAADLIALTPDNWPQQLAAQPVDALLVESAWQGNQGLWHQKVGHYSDEQSAPLRALLNYCHQQQIPTLFWNKEDPVHFERFIANAALFDHVFSSDANSLPRYLSYPQRRNKTVSSMAFFASPQLHNPLPATVAWQDSVAYGGSYYGERYAERTAALLPLLNVAAEKGLTIYDRQHHNADSPYRFPQTLASYVKGGLSYSDMVQAYKAHPVHINVNSVQQSPTMFSRRVMELAACGTPVLTASGEAMRQYAGDAVFFADDKTQAEQVLQQLAEPAARWQAGLAGVRAVYGTHTAAHRLCLMLRTAGIIQSAPQLPVMWLVLPQLTLDGAQAILRQSQIPQAVLATQIDEDARALLTRQGIITTIEAAREAVAKQAEVQVVLARSEHSLTDAADLGDLQLTTLYSPYAVAAFCRELTPDTDGWPGLTTLIGKPDFSLLSYRITPAQLQQPDILQLRLTLSQHSKQQTCLLLRKPPLTVAATPVKAAPTLLIAGHDLKFIRPFYPQLQQAGFRLLIDQWQGHQQHDAEHSKQLLRQADIIFCEWMLGNAQWYARHKLPSQRLFGRLHAQELSTSLFSKLNFNAFTQVFAVAEHIRQRAITLRPDAVSRIQVLPNAVDTQKFTSDGRTRPFGKVLAIAGIVPQLKRFDRALDILAQLRKTDSGYVLRVKGKLPADYSWMKAHRKEEMAWYDALFSRIAQDPLLTGAVVFDAHGDDMPHWYKQVDVILSTSDSESFHFSVAEGVASGCLPVVFNWEGADKLYPASWCVHDVSEACERILQVTWDAETMRQNQHWIDQHYALNRIGSALLQALLGTEEVTTTDNQALSC